MDLDPARLEAFEPAEVREGVVELLALLHDDRRLLDGHRCRGVDSIEDEGVGGLLDEVEDIVEGTDQAVDVLAIERRDEGPFETVADLVAELVAAVLGVADLLRPLFRGVVGSEHRLEQAGRAEDVCRILGEEVEEPFLAWDQAQSHAARVAAAPRRLCDARPVDGLVIAFVAAQAIALAIAIGIALSRGRTLDAIRDALAAAGSGEETGPDAEEVTDRVRRVRRRAESAEFSLEQRLRDLAYLADLVGVGIVRLSDKLQVEVANTAAHVFIGREAGSMVGRTAMEALGDHRIEAIAHQARDAGASSGEVVLRGDAGVTLVVRARRSPILGVWLVLEDVAELRRLQRIRAEFIDNLSHELRTPITTVGLLAETLARDADLAGDAVPAKMRERIGKLEVETGNIAEMVSELLDLARIESGGRQLHLDEVDLGAVAAESADRLRPFAERQGVQLRTEIAPSLPVVRGEAVRLGQVFANLIHNAVKFSRQGGEVWVGVERTGESLSAWVRDSGIGIGVTDQARIFERFYKADRTRTSGGGTGLGLAIARHIVEGHGGSMRVESVEGEGSRFTFTVPVAAPVATST
jgi:two-component system phosphate regulon sensor histidine kinase PhoR